MMAREASKTHLPKTRVGPQRMETYRAAHEAARESLPDLSWTDWLRRACDEQARRDLRKAPKAR